MSELNKDHKIQKKIYDMTSQSIEMNEWIEKEGWERLKNISKILIKIKDIQ